jgi:hypothetical protein
MDQHTRQFYEQKLGRESLKLTQILRIQRGINEQRQRLLQLLKEETENNEGSILGFYEVEEKAKQIEAAEIELIDHINDLMMQCGEKMDDLQSGRFKIPENNQRTRSQASSSNHLRSSGQAVMRIYVKDLASKSFTFEVNPNNTIKDIKRMVQVTGGYSQNLQNLFFKGKRLEDNRTLSYYNIQSEAILHMILKLRNQ